MYKSTCRVTNLLAVPKKLLNVKRNVNNHTNRILMREKYYKEKRIDKIAKTNNFNS